jgi:hypothetical protein
VPTPFGRISKLAASYLFIVFVVIGFGLIVPGATGKWLLVGGVLAVALPVVGAGLRTTPRYGDQKNEEPQPPPWNFRR